ncbi:MAG: CGGC domain-containing protein [Spirochaetes bacterium RBG_13_68_11]|nr:MAG: CGGC domain-containing protein [Spirochaetes bacterium RBG_13_68_11]
MPDGCSHERGPSGGKCFRSLRNREGAFSRYRNVHVEFVGYTACDGCPGGTIEYAVDEMKANGATVIHLATGLVVGYPPCPRLEHFRSFIMEKFALDVVYGTHPIPPKYLDMHSRLGTWEDPRWKEIIEPTMADERTWLSCN